MGWGWGWGGGWVEMKDDEDKKEIDAHNDGDRTRKGREGRQKQEEITG
jgi:hypothetical protein